MGVTIHFEGKLKTETDYQLVIQKAKDFANLNNYEHFEIKEENKILQRVKNEEDWDYEGATNGIQINPSKNTEPFILEFDKDLYVQEYCKTQFSEQGIHINLIDFLEQIKHHFESLEIFDEGEYFETKDEQVLINNLNSCWDQLDKAKSENPKVKGPIKIESGRIIDFAEYE
jgi:hypothetical protein